VQQCIAGRSASRALNLKHIDAAAHYALPNIVVASSLQRSHCSFAGVVYLYGEVGTGLERENTESLVGEIPGVARVVDSIFVSY
jgi:hypothetical protein